MVIPSNNELGGPLTILLYFGRGHNFRRSKHPIELPPDRKFYKFAEQVRRRLVSRARGLPHL